MQKQPQYFVGLDVGTTAVRCVIGVAHEGELAPNILGVGKSHNMGMRKGSVVTLAEVAEAIDRAAEDAERTAGHKVVTATVNINGTQVAGMNSRGVIAVSSANKEISHHELERVEEAATVVQLPPNREIVHVFPKKYRLDGQDNVKDPIGMHGIRLEVDAHVVTASTPALRNLYKSLDGAGIHIHNRVLSGIASADAVLNRSQRENGVVLIDVGGGTTNVAVYEEGDLQHVAVLPVGSINITNDLAIGLRTDLDVAERVKLEFENQAGTKPKKDLKVTLNDKDYHFDMQDIAIIIQARLDELFELVNKELSKIDRAGKLPGGAVFVGGGAKLSGLAEYAKDSLRLPARVSHPSGFTGVTDEVNDPEYAAAIGLMLADIEPGEANSHAVGESARAGFNATKKRLKGLIDRFRP